MHRNSLGLHAVVGCCFIFTLTLSMAKAVYGMEISPMVTALSIDSRPNYQQILIKNNSNVTLPVEIDVNRIQFNPFAVGSSYTVVPETTPDLLVFPPAIVLAPGAVQSVRVQWLGQKSLPESQSYFIRFSQPQLSDDNTNKSGVKIFVHFNAAVHVSASGMKPLLVIKRNSITQQAANGEKENPSQDKQAKASALLQFSIDNQGGKYADLNDYRLIITRVDGTELTIQGEALVAEQTNTFFPPNSKRNLSIHLDRPLSVGFSLALTPIEREP
jgi:P pilus assembly chaperone PapD